MSTRGCIGYRLDGKDKLSYNHSDSYPSGLGTSTLAELRKMVLDLATLKQRVRSLVMVKEGKPTPQAVLEAASKAEVIDLRVAGQNVNDPYCVLRGIQGEWEKTLQVGYAIEYAGFMKSSLHCEWAYVVNLDSGNLEVYRGFNRGKKKGKKWVPERTEGRYAALSSDVINGTFKPDYKGEEPFFGVSLVAEWPLNDLPSDEEMVKLDHD